MCVCVCNSSDLSVKMTFFLSNHMMTSQYYFKRVRIIANKSSHSTTWCSHIWNQYRNVIHANKQHLNEWLLNFLCVWVYILLYIEWVYSPFIYSWWMWYIFLKYSLIMQVQFNKFSNLQINLYWIFWVFVCVCEVYIYRFFVLHLQKKESVIEIY